NPTYERTVTVVGSPPAPQAKPRPFAEKKPSFGDRIVMSTDAAPAPPANAPGPVPAPTFGAPPPPARPPASAPTPPFQLGNWVPATQREGITLVQKRMEGTMTLSSGEADAPHPLIAPFAVAAPGAAAKAGQAQPIPGAPWAPPAAPPKVATSNFDFDE